MVGFYPILSIIPFGGITLLPKGGRPVMAAVGRLVVILAADVVGYPSLSEADEESTLERLEAHRQQFVYPKIAERDGRIARTSGGSLLVEFASPTDAVRCAVEVQRGMFDRNIGAAPDRRIAFRIGINIGEVTATGGDLVSRAVAALPTERLMTLVKPGTEIYGDSGKIAERIAALAEPGVIAVVPIEEAALEVQLRLGDERLLARVTRRSGATLGLVPGREVFAVIKTVAIDRRSLGHQGEAVGLDDGVEVYDG